MKYKRSKTTAAVYAHERTIFAFATAFLTLAFMMYMYFLCVSVVNIVIRKSIDIESTEVATHIKTLESRYIDAQGKVTKEAAVLHGFSSATDKTYITRKPANLVLNKNDES